MINNIPIFLQQKNVENEMTDDKESVGSEALGPSSTWPFQSLLVQFLDNSAPVLGL